MGLVINNPIHGSVNDLLINEDMTFGLMERFHYKSGEPENNRGRK